VRSKVSTTRPMYSSELGRLAGLSTDTLRYYERLRLLPAAPRSASGYRLFPPQALNRIRLIRGALAIGFSVRELTAIFAERDHGGAPCHHVRDLAREKLAACRSLAPQPASTAVRTEDHARDMGPPPTKDPRGTRSWIAGARLIPCVRRVSSRIAP
jgi:DNA-binding transcriptional MerR regulator